MKDIEKISDMIECEIEKAEDYMKCAFYFKESRPQLSDTIYKIAGNKINDMNLLHAQIVSIIEEYKKEHGEPPESMKILYNILHKKHIENAATVKGMMALYKEQ